MLRLTPHASLALSTCGVPTSVMTHKASSARPEDKMLCRRYKPTTHIHPHGYPRRQQARYQQPDGQRSQQRISLASWQALSARGMPRKG